MERGPEPDAAAPSGAQAAGGTEPHGAQAPVGVSRAGQDGAGERNRTADLRITSALLYQLSYTSPSLPDSTAGATPRNRTADTQIFSLVLYQLS